MNDAETVADAPKPQHAALSWRDFPRSLWVWLAILAATFALPALYDAKTPTTKAGNAATTTSASFAELSQAEYQARLALSPLLSGQPTRDPRTGKTISTTQMASAAYRRLAETKNGVVSARKTLVLEHRDKKPLNDAFLTGVLAKNLSKRGEKAGAIATELAFWRTLYGNAAQPVDASSVDAYIKRVKSYNLGLLEPVAIADVYEKAGRIVDADRVRKTFGDKATFDALRLVVIFAVLGIAALVGFVFLILFASSWRGNNWRNVGRVAQVDAAPAPFAGLIDVFVAYLALLKGVGLLIGAIPALNTASPVALSAGVYVGTGILSALYLWNRAQAGKWSWEILGLRGANLGNIVYGVAGYCAALPITLALGAFNNAVFKKDDSNLSPNPVLPMIAGEENPVGRIVLFLLVAVAAPIIEELFFRGVLYSALKTRFSTVACVVISAACFAVVHPMGDWLPIFGLGCLLATVRELRQSVVPGIVLHFCQNAMAFTLMSSLFSR